MDEVITCLIRNTDMGSSVSVGPKDKSQVRSVTTNAPSQKGRLGTNLGNKAPTTQVTVVQAAPAQQQKQQQYYQPPPQQVHHQPQQYHQSQHYHQQYQQPVQHYQQPQYQQHNGYYQQQQPPQYNQSQAQYQHQQYQHSQQQAQYQQHQQPQYQQHQYQELHLPEPQQQRQTTSPQRQATPQRQDTPKGNIGTAAAVLNQTSSCTGNTETKTPKEVLEHNILVRKNKQHSEYWVILEMKIYLTAITQNLFKAYKQSMRDILNVEPEEETDKQYIIRLDRIETLEHPDGWMRFGQTIFQALHHFKFDKNEIMDKALPFYVCDLKVYSKHELRDEFKVEILELSTELGIEGTDGYWMNEYQKCLTRRLKTIGNVQDAGIPSGDPNKSTFNLPEGVDSKDMREWSENWELFETLEEGGLFSDYIDYPLMKDDRDQHKLFPETLRTWYNGWRLFDLSIDGEAAWNVLPTGVITEDVVTENQLKVIESRKKRRHFGDLKRMAARRERLAEHFKAYAKDKPYVTRKLDHVSWAARMEESWQKLQDLS
ncbi:unnamed protein product [Owenia fusiformis]|uniref:Uncharacterized protein n=1 Tax=Owenia fusiformis TaxID=6347 RepID=A0A8S4P717_OWEFU|nr:unnamed protein product [Owenia fusiformis]